MTEIFFLIFFFTLQALVSNANALLPLKVKIKWKSAPNIKFNKHQRI